MPEKKIPYEKREVLNVEQVVRKLIYLAILLVPLGMGVGFLIGLALPCGGF